MVRHKLLRNHRESLDLIADDPVLKDKRTVDCDVVFYAVIDERYKAGLSVIITTNLTMEELRQPEDVAHARIYSRVLEMCTPVQVTGEDRRQKIGSRKQTVVKEVLDL